MKIAESTQGFERIFSPIMTREAGPTEAREANPTVERTLAAKDLAEIREKNILSDVELEKLESATNSIREYVSSMGVKLEFNIHQESDRVQVRVVNPENEKVIREIPPDEVLNLASSIEEMLGLFLNKSL